MHYSLYNSGKYIILRLLSIKHVEPPKTSKILQNVRGAEAKINKKNIGAGGYLCDITEIKCPREIE